jgi:hypothetical protein
MPPRSPVKLENAFAIQWHPNELLPRLYTVSLPLVLGQGKLSFAVHG